MLRPESCEPSVHQGQSPAVHEAHFHEHRFPCQRAWRVLHAGPWAMLLGRVSSRRGPDWTSLPAVVKAEMDSRVTLLAPVSQASTRGSPRPWRKSHGSSRRGNRWELSSRTSILKPDRSGQIACEMLVDSLRGLFAGIEVVLLDAAVWGTVSRSRPRSHHISYPDLYEVT